jgi:hypothetical protein
MKKQSFNFLLFIFLICSFPVQAQHFAKYAGEFMSIGTGPRALGMGSAYVAVADGSISSYWNPAGLAKLKYPEIHLMYSERFSGIVKYNFAVVALPYKSNSGVSFGLMRMGIDDIPITSLKNPDLPVGAIFEDGNGNQIRNTPYIDHTVGDVEYVGYFSYAKKWRENRWIGGNIKIIRKSVGENSAWGIGFDLGLLMPIYRGLRFGANVQDITSTLITWDTGNKELVSPNLKWGFAYQYRFSKFSILPAFDIDTRFEGRKFAAQQNIGPVSFDLHTGVEASYRNVVFLRTGYDIGHFAAGAGIQLPRLRFDAAFLNHQDLGDTYRIALTLSLEEDKFKRK